jgi:membrane-associated protein
MKKLITIVLALIVAVTGYCQDTSTIKFRNQYKAEVKHIEVVFNNSVFKPDEKGNVKLLLNASDSFLVKGENYEAVYFSLSNADKYKTIFLHKNFSWTDLLTPMFYIIFGGIWFIVFVVFAETGLFAGFFLPGDSLLFVTGIYSLELVQEGLGIHGTGGFLSLVILGIIISAAGILGNYVGYWFGKKTGPLLFEKNIFYRHAIFMKNMAAGQSSLPGSFLSYALLRQ